MIAATWALVLATIALAFSTVGLLLSTRQYTKATREMSVSTKRYAEISERLLVVEQTNLTYTLYREYRAGNWANEYQKLFGDAKQDILGRMDIAYKQSTERLLDDVLGQH